VWNSSIWIAVVNEDDSIRIGGLKRSQQDVLNDGEGDRRSPDRAFY
jgi:hypothetical protein